MFPRVIFMSGMEKYGFSCGYVDMWWESEIGI